MPKKKLVSVDENYDLPEKVSQRQIEKTASELLRPSTPLYKAVQSVVSPSGIAARVMPLVDIACYGESTTESVGTNWPVNYLATYLGVPVLNKGVSGQGAADILLRMGAIQPRVSLENNVIPSSGSATVVSIDPSRGWRVNGTGSFAATGTLAGIEGSLSHNTSTDVWTFVRATAGASVSVPSGTPFIRKESLANPHHRIILGTLRNNVTTGDLGVATDLVMLAPQALKTEIKKLLVWGCINGTNEPKGHSRYSQIVKANSRLSDFYGENFYDIRRDFITTGLDRAGISPTPEDLANIEKDCPPPSLMADAIHPNSAGYEVIAKLLAEKVLALGWVDSITIPDSPKVPVEAVLVSDSFNRADGALGSTDSAYGGSSTPWSAEAQVSIKSNNFYVSGQSVNRLGRLTVENANHHVKAKIVNGSSARGCGVTAGGLDNQNYYRLDNAATGLAIFKVVNGTSTPIWGPGPIASDGDIIGIMLGTTSIKATLNGSVVGTSSTLREITGGKIVGLRSSWSTETIMDDFVVTEVIEAG